MDLRCDGRRQCRDGTDEQDCTLVQPAVGYDRFLTPPPAKPEDESLVVNMTLEILNIVNIDQVKGIFYTTVSVQALWFDSGLSYNKIIRE